METSEIVACVVFGICGVVGLLGGVAIGLGLHIREVYGDD